MTTEISRMPASTKKGRVSLFFKDIWKNKVLYLLFLPVLIYYIVFKYIPMYGVIIAFKNYNIYDGIAQSPWVGWKNFEQFFNSIYFFRLLRNTLAINFLDILIGFPAPIIFALMLNEITSKFFKRTIQTISYIPHFISIVVVVSMVVNFLSLNTGIVNNIISLFGGHRTYFLTEPKYFWGIFTTMNIWKGLGWGAIIYIASLTSIDISLYEAAVIDGAGRWKQTLNITIPGILPTIIIMFLLRIGHLLEVGYESIILMYNSKLYPTADVFSTYIYRTGLASSDPNYSLATAIGLFQSGIGLILVVLCNKLSKKYSEQALW